jgi:hypothetical protein
VEKRDYLVEQIEKFARVLGNILFEMKGNSKGNIDNVIKLCQTELSKILDTDFEILTNLESEKLIEKFFEKGITNYELIEDYADILHEISVKIKDRNKREIYLKMALNIYKETDKITRVFSQDRISKIIDIQYLLN